MQLFASILMAVVLFIHAAFGCCWHHAHCCPAADAICDRHCSHDHDEPNRQSGEEELECEGTCQYVMPEKVWLDGLGFASWIVLAAPPATFADRPVTGAAHCGEWRCPIDSGPPLRLHLLHQLLLI
jgi:hypothetical protein